MDRDTEELIKLLFTPLPGDQARELAELCREELAGLAGDPRAGHGAVDGDADPAFDEVFEAAVTLLPQQRRRLITCLVNYEVLQKRYGSKLMVPTAG